jgi:hypothetical protein
MHARSKWISLAVVVLGVVGVPMLAQAAGLTLTPAGMAQGLSLTTFATGFPTVNVGNGLAGPFGIEFPTTGGVLVTDVQNNIRLFPTDTDGQNAASITPINNFGSAGAGGLAQLNGIIYMPQPGSGNVVQLVNNGASTQVVVSGNPGVGAIVASPSNNLLYVDRTGNGPPISIVDPVAKTTTLFQNVEADGLSLSPDGKTLYAAIIAGAASGHILGFDTTTKAQVYDSGLIPGGVDGTAVGTGSFSGFIFANTNSGTLFEVTLGSTPVQTLIASGGSRGDFVTVDPLTNTLLITQSDSIIRLHGASFITVPEPASLVMVGTSVLTGIAYGWRRLKAKAVA